MVFFIKNWDPSLWNILMFKCAMQSQIKVKVCITSSGTYHSYLFVFRQCELTLLLKAEPVSKVSPLRYRYFFGLMEYLIGKKWWKLLLNLEWCCCRQDRVASNCVCKMWCKCVVLTHLLTYNDVFGTCKIRRWDVLVVFDSVIEHMPSLFLCLNWLTCYQKRSY